MIRRRLTPTLRPGPSPGQLVYISTTAQQAPLSVTNAVSTLNELVPFLYPHVPSDPSALPVYSFRQTTSDPPHAYVAHLRLAPIDSRLPAGQNEFESPPMPNKKDAKKHVALIACHVLHQRNLPAQDAVPSARAHLKPRQVALPSSLRLPAPSLNQLPQLPTLKPLNQLASSKPPPPAALPSPQPSIAKPADPRLQRLIAKPVPATPRDISDLPELVPLACPHPFGQARRAALLFLHPLTIHLPPPDAQPYALGLVCSRALEAGALERTINGHALAYTLGAPVALRWTAAQRAACLDSLDNFTRHVIQTVVCRTRYAGELTYLLAPLTSAGEIDLALLSEPTPLRSLSDFVAAELLTSPLDALRYRLFHPSPTAPTLTLASTHADIPSDSPLARFAKHLKKFSSLAHFYTVVLAIPAALQVGPLVQLDCVLSFSDDGAVQLVQANGGERYAAVLPLGVLQQTRLPLAFWRAAAWTPFFARAIADASHARAVCAQVGSTTLSSARVVEALTPPGRGVCVDYETLETVGDAFLKLASTVHIYLSNPSFDEGQLSGLRSRQTDNAFLRRKCLDSGLAKHVLLSRFRTSDKFVAVNELEDGVLSEDGECLAVTVGRKVLSDVTESLLGAAYVSGGIEDGLLVGTRMGLCLGGATPWEARPGAAPNATAGVAAVGLEVAGLDELEARLGHTFADRGLLVRALTHRSATETYADCYQRLEWLGDAVLDLWVVQTLYRKLAPVTPMQLTLMRASLVSNGTLGFIGLRKLLLADLIVQNVPGLANQLKDVLEDFGTFDSVGAFFSDLVNAFVVAEAPKIVSDVVEALVGAVFVDCGFKVEKAFGVLERVYSDAVVRLERCEPRDPVSCVYLLRSLSGCKQIVVETRARTDAESDTCSSEEAWPGSGSEECVVSFHGARVGKSRFRGPGRRGVAQQRASQMAMGLLERARAMERCDCEGKRKKMASGEGGEIEEGGGCKKRIKGEEVQADEGGVGWGKCSEVVMEDGFDAAGGDGNVNETQNGKVDANADESTTDETIDVETSAVDVKVEVNDDNDDEDHLEDEQKDEEEITFVGILGKES